MIPRALLYVFRQHAGRRRRGGGASPRLGAAARSTTDRWTRLGDARRIHGLRHPREVGLWGAGYGRRIPRGRSSFKLHRTGR